MFNQTMKHVDSYAEKLPIAFHCLIIEIILKQHPNIVHAEEMKKKKPLPLTLNYKLFVGAYILGTVVPRNQGKYADENFSFVSKAT